MIANLRIGHYTNLEKGTGLTVFLFNGPATGIYHICGSSPATRELHTLDLDSNINEMHGLLFTGGSAFGLAATEGVMQYLDEQKLGKKMPHGVVPIVPSAAIYDLAIKTAHFPSPKDAYEACQNATINNTTEGRIGCGTGASVGKIVPDTARMSGGFGHAHLQFENGAVVSVYVVVNSIGDIRQGDKIIAGAKYSNNEFADCEKFLLSGGEEKYLAQDNTTLVGVFTNVKFNKIELKRIAKMAVAGLAQVISPSFTRYDGDIIFCVSLGELIVSEITIGAVAVELIKQSIINAVKEAVILPMVNK